LPTIIKLNIVVVKILSMLGSTEPRVEDPKHEKAKRIRDEIWELVAEAEPQRRHQARLLPAASATSRTTNTDRAACGGSI
jgi:hypothetical protein